MTANDLIKMARAGAVFYVSHSGGKDSQAMYLYLSKIISRDRLVVVHADLGEIEWAGVQDHINNTISLVHELNVVRAGKTFFDMVEHRFNTRPDAPSWPSSAHRQCTSDLKRAPIQKFIRQDMKKRGATVAVNCTGIRAEESSARAKQNPFKINKALTNKTRTVYDWMPIFEWSTENVFEWIREAGQKPHWAYEKNERLSCVFCIMGSKNDLRHGAEQRPELLQKYLELEQKTGYTLFRVKNQNIPLDQYIGVEVNYA